MPVWSIITEDLDRGARILVKEYAPRLYATAYRLCLNEYDAEDLVQRTLAKAVSSISSFTGKSSFFTWLCAILMNFRKMDVRRKAANALVFHDGDVPDIPDAHPDPGEALAISDEADAIRAAVARLPECLRLPVVMYYFNGVPAPEIAKASGVPEGTVYYRLHEARAQIREFIAKVLQCGGIKQSEGAQE